MFICYDGGWQISREHGIHKCSPARDYMVQWIQENNKLHLKIKNYEVIEQPKQIITTVETIFDVIDYIHLHKNIHF